MLEKCNLWSIEVLNYLHFILIVVFVILLIDSIWSKKSRVAAVWIILIITAQPTLSGSCIVTDFEKKLLQSCEIGIGEDVFLTRFLKDNFGIDFYLSHGQVYSWQGAISLASIAFLISHYYEEKILKEKNNRRKER